LGYSKRASQQQQKGLKMKENNKPHQIRHGELLFIPVDKIPKGAKLISKSNSVIVGLSETHHNHILTLPKTAEAILRVFEFEGRTYLDVPLEAKLSHQKTVEAHPTKIMQPGFYEKLVHRAYSYGEKISKKVID